MKKLLLLSASLVLAGCQTTGTSIGAVVGGTAGNLACRGEGGVVRGLCTAGGLALGGFLGNRIGKYLDERDQLRMAKATETALETGQTQKWVGDESGVRGEARVVSSTTKTKTVKVPVLKDRISEVPPLDVVGETYKANKQANLRGGPGTDYVKVGSLVADEKINVVGKVKEKDWFLISQSGVGSGFVFSSLVSPAPNAEPAELGLKIEKSNVSKQSVSVDQTCRQIEQKITLADGTQHSETIEACEDTKNIA